MISTRVGDVITNKRGEKMAICRFQNNNNIDVIFEGTNHVIKNQTWSAFRNRRIVDAVSPQAEAYEQIFDYEGRPWDVITEKDGVYTVRNVATGEIVSDITKKQLEDGLNLSDAEALDYLKKSEKANSAGKHRAMTKDQAMFLLQKYRRCAIVRPPGFGKTVIALKMFHEPQYKRCLFLSPNDSTLDTLPIKNEQLKQEGIDPNDRTVIDAHTYAWLATRSLEQIKKMDYDLVFCDECHLTGGDDEKNGKGAAETYKSLLTLMYTHPQTHFCGATATPSRMDGIDVIGRLFQNHVCYPYDLSDAVADGICFVPHYYTRLCHTKEYVNWRIKEKQQEHQIALSQEDIQKIYSDDVIRKINMENMPQAIKEACSKHVADTSYMRFLIFFNQIEDIFTKGEEVKDWFKKAYPGYRIHTTEIYTGSDKEVQDLAHLPHHASPDERGRIDLIMNCNMLNMTYHSEYTTGEVLYDGTASYTRYFQRVGRLFSEPDRIVFDIPGNIDVDFQFGNQTAESNLPTQTELKQIIAPIQEHAGLTYAQVVGASKGRDWDKIDQVTEEYSAKKALEEVSEIEENILTDFEDEGDDAPTFLRDIVPAGINPVTSSLTMGGKSAEVRAYEAFDEYIQKENVSLEEGVSKYDRFLKHITAVKAPAKRSVLQEIDIAEDFGFGVCDDEIASEAIEEDEKCGYSANTLVHRKETDTLISTNPELQWLQRTVDEVIDKICMRPKMEIAQKAAEELSKLPMLNDPNSTYSMYTPEEIEDGIDTKDIRYTLFTAIVKKYHIDPMTILQFVKDNNLSFEPTSRVQGTLDIYAQPKGLNIVKDTKEEEELEME